MSRNRHSPQAPCRTACQRGISLIELVLFIVIVSVALVGVLAALNQTVWKSADPIVRKQVIAVAEAMMSEVMLKEYGDPDAECTPSTTPSCNANTPADRQNYNDVSDYHGWNQTGVRSLADATAAPIAGLEAYTVAVAVVPATLSGVAGKSITVTVNGSGESFILVGYRMDF